MLDVQSPSYQMQSISAYKKIRENKHLTFIKKIEGIDLGQLY